MANLPPPNNDLNVPEDEQAPAAPVGFAPQWIGWQDPNNNNGWLDEYDDEDPEEDEANEDNNDEIEEEDKEIEDEEEEEIVAGEEAEIIYPYDKADPNNRPPPASDDESEFAPLVIPMFDAENRPILPVIYFSCIYEWGESSLAREILKYIGKVSPLGPVTPTIGIAMSRIRKLNEQKRERVEVDESMMETMSLEFDTTTPTSKNAAMADDDVKDDNVEDDDDMDEDATDPSDPQSSKPNRSPHDSQIMPPKQMSQAAIAKLVADEVAKALATDCATRNTTGAGGSGNVGGA
ncbi:hypothetical protein Tco_1026706, partial [Tanacetum coccineum]